MPRHWTKCYCHHSEQDLLKACMDLTVAERPLCLSFLAQLLSLVLDTCDSQKDLYPQHHGLEIVVMEWMLVWKYRDPTHFVYLDRLSYCFQFPASTSLSFIYIKLTLQNINAIFMPRKSHVKNHMGTEFVKSLLISFSLSTLENVNSRHWIALVVLVTSVPHEKE